MSLSLRIRSARRRCPTPALPPELVAALNVFLLLLNQLFTLVIGILFPAVPTALSVVSDFGVFAALVFGTIAIIKKFTNW